MFPLDLLMDAILFPSVRKRLMLEQGSTVSRDFHGGGADHMFMGVSKGVQRHIKAQM